VFESAARAAGFTGFGFYQRVGFMHVDTGPERSWGKRWPMITFGN
jgi:zinc D-Ala-D-Ala carboxypeptidase